jgi:16S rRNA (cytidine1402-2'-O)-methyltransferase
LGNHAIFYYAAIAQRHHPGAALGDHAVVRHDQNCRTEALVNVANQRQDVRAGVGIEVARRLVGKQDRRVDRQRPRDCDALALASRKLVGQMIQAMPELHQVQQFLRTLHNFTSGPAAQMQRNRDVLQARERRQKIEELKNEADFVAAYVRQGVIGELAELRAVDRDLAGSRVIEAADQVEERRFSRAGRAHDPNHLTAGDFKIDAVQRRDAPLAIIFFGDVGELNHPGTLYIIATPIGNLEDITYRAVRVLGEADLIACEDTRQTRKLLDRYGISKPLTSYHEHNEGERSDELVGQLEAGRNIALVSDAGTPLIADPGYRLVQKARAKGIAVSPLPGPSAMIAALSASGLPTDAFEFHGFIAAKTNQRRSQLEGIKDSASTQVFYEAPHRIVETLDDIAEILGGRPVVVARELTKIHEEFLSGSAAELRDVLRSRNGVKGEFTIMIGKETERAVDSRPVEEAVAELVAQGVARMDAYKRVARERGISKRDVYKRCESK